MRQTETGQKLLEAIAAARDAAPGDPVIHAFTATANKLVLAETYVATLATALDDTTPPSDVAALAGARHRARDRAPGAVGGASPILPWPARGRHAVEAKFDPEIPGGPDGARRASFDFPPVDRARLPRVLGALREVAGARASRSRASRSRGS